MNQFARFGRVTPADRRTWRTERRHVVDGFDVSAVATPADTVCVGDVDDDGAVSAALDAAVAGASLAVVVADSHLDALVDDLARLGVEISWDADTGDSSGDDDEWAGLLERLAAGSSVAQAARECHLSLRSAYRRLSVGRRVLGVTSNTAAVVAWRSGANKDPAAGAAPTASQRPAIRPARRS